MSPVELETPRPVEEIYYARGADVDPHRPVFTGDVFKLSDGGEVLILHHPCALRTDGVRLVPKVLCAPVVDSAKPRSNWAAESFKVMPLPSLTAAGAYRAADFSMVSTVGSSDLRIDQRIAVLSQQGVNILMQRYVFFSSRVVIPTLRFNEAIAGEYEEAELASEWGSEYAEQLRGDAAQDFHLWIRGMHTGAEVSRQSILPDPRRRAGVRREMMNHLRALREIP